MRRLNALTSAHRSPRPWMGLLLACVTACGGEDAGPSGPGADPGADGGVAPAVGLALRVDDAARACELLIDDPASRLELAFAPEIAVRQLRRGPRLALAFAQPVDAPFGPAALALVARGGAEDVGLSVGECVDGAGQPVGDIELINR